MSEFKLPHHSDFLKLNPGAQAVLAIRGKHEALNGAPGEKVEDLKKLENGAAYMALGGPTGILGIALTDEIPTADGAGRYTEFQRGAIYWSPSTGANGVWGDIRNRWSQLGKEQSYLGLPLTDERAWTDPDNNKAGRISHFQRGAIAWTADNRKTVSHSAQARGDAV